MKFYAVPVGHATGVFTDWDKAAAMIKDFQGGILASFGTIEEAYAFVKKHEKTGASHTFSWKPVGGIRPEPIKVSTLDDKPEEIDDSPPQSKTGTAREAKKHKTELSEQYTLWFDGGSRGNGTSSAEAGAGWVLKRASGDRVSSGFVYMGKATNNEAEYTGLIKGLHDATLHGIFDLHVKGDSELVIKQVMGHYKVKAENLKPLHAEAKQLCESKFDRIKFEHIPRALNTEADALANRAINEKKSNRV
jgi:ribonuclease HI